MRFRTIIGALYYDWPRFVRALIRRRGWVLMRNRADIISVAAGSKGVSCDWEGTRSLHLCNIFPLTSNWLLRRALIDCPLSMKSSPSLMSSLLTCFNSSFSQKNPKMGVESLISPAVSFLIGHRGTERIPLLLATLQSIASQTNVPFECIVVEQDSVPLIREHLPIWVRYKHAPASGNGDQYNRSQAFNDAAELARGEVLILHDNDMLVPMGYAKEAVDLFRAGYEVAQLTRFVFYIDQVSSQMCYQGKVEPVYLKSESVIENVTGGGSLVISKNAYWDMGGMDESFVGWGGEDEELWDRCQTRVLYRYGSLPLIHMWHPPQEGKRAINGQGAYTAGITASRRQIAVENRIKELKSLRKKKAARS